MAGLFSPFGLPIQPYFLKVILPVGISFYTFQTMSYTIDIYRKQMKPTSNFLDFALFFNLFALPILAFRAASVTQTYNMFTSLIMNFQVSDTGLLHAVLKTVFYIGVLVAVQVFQYRKNDLMVIQKCNIWIKAIFYCICFYLSPPGPQGNI